MTLEEIKTSITVPDAARLYGLRVNRSGMACCPAHDDRTASLKLYKDHFFCFSCGRHGDVVDLVALLTGTDFSGAFAALGGTYDDADPAETRRAIMKARSASWLRDLLEDFRRQRLRSIVEDINRLRDLGAEEWPFSPAWCMLQDRLEDLERLEEYYASQ